MTIKSETRKRMKSSSFGLPKKRKFPLNTKSRAISAVAYAKKGARDRTITPRERDIVLRKAHAKYPELNIKPIRKGRGKWSNCPGEFNLHHSECRTCPNSDICKTRRSLKR